MAKVTEKQITILELDHDESVVLKRALMKINPEMVGNTEEYDCVKSIARKLPNK